MAFKHLQMLTPAETQSDLWRRLAANMRQEVERYRDELELTQNNDATTATLRAKIAVLRELLALARGPATRQPAVEFLDETGLD